MLYCILANRTPVDASDTALKICTDRWVVLRVIGATATLSKECILYVAFGGPSMDLSPLSWCLGVLILGPFHAICNLDAADRFEGRHSSDEIAARCDFELVA